MLYHLAKYSESLDLNSRPGYSRKKIAAIITIDVDGKILQAEPVQVSMVSPSLSQPELIFGGKKRSHFLVDSAATVTGWGNENSIEKHRAFVEIHQEAALHVQDLIPLSLALNDDENIDALIQKLAMIDVKQNENITFKLAGDDRCIIEQDSWRTWWEQYRASLSANQSSSPMRCFVTGQLVNPILTHPKLNLSRVGGQSTGSSLIGFDKDAFSSYGLQQSHNASCSEEAAAIYTDALTHLMGQAPRPLANTYMLHWLDKQVPPKEDPFLFLSETMEKGDDSNQSTVMDGALQLSEAAQKGNKHNMVGNKYHVILLSGAAGRAMIRGVFEGELTELYPHINDWLDDLSIVSPYGGDIAKPPQLYALLIRILPFRQGISGKNLQDEMDRHAAPLLTCIWSSILQSAPFPQEAAYKALQYIKSRLACSKENEKEQGHKNIDRIACAVLKLWHNRAARNGLSGSRDVYIGQKLDVEFLAQAYHVGRLIAVLNYLQQSALGYIQADIKQQFFSMASVAPGLIVGRLIDESEEHLSRLQMDGEVDLHIQFQQMITDIVARLDMKTLIQFSFVEQVQFVLGYYHQNAFLSEECCA